MPLHQGSPVAHNYGKDKDGRVALNMEGLNAVAFEKYLNQADISKLPDKKDYEDHICAFAIVSYNENSDGSETLTIKDYFIPKTNFNNVNFELFAINDSDTDTYVKEIFFGSPSITSHYKVLETVIIKGKDGNVAVGGPITLDEDSRTARAFVRINSVLYAPSNLTLAFYTSKKANERWHDIEDRIGILKADGTVNLFKNVIMLGDVNHDNKIDAEDYETIKNYINGKKTIAKEFEWAADVNGDKTIDIEDVILISNHVKGIKRIENKYHFIETDTPAVTTTTNPLISTTTTTTAESVTTTAPVTTTVSASKTGDVNRDGSIDLKDVVLLRRYIAGGWGVTLDEYYADVNGDEELNLKDVVLLRRYIAGGWGVTLAEKK